MYRVGFTTNDVDIEIAKFRMNELVERILADTKATSYQLYLTASKDDTAFRRKVYPSYKQNRKAPRPIHYDALREFLVFEWNASVVSTIEADDALAIEQYSSAEEETVIVSIDKDLDTIPGWHYNFVKGLSYFIDEEQGMYNFYKQLLMGDVADNVKGIKGIGEKKAGYLLDGCLTEEELFNAARAAYGNDEEMLVTGEVLWILREHYPQGKWSCTLFGGMLKHAVDNEPTLDFLTSNATTESTGEEMLTNGFLRSGSSPLESITGMAGSQT